MACPAPRAAEREPGLSVFVPQWAGIYEAFCLQQPYRRLPVSSRVRCLDHEYAPVGVSAEDIEFPVVVSYGRCPHPVPVLRHTPPLLSPRHRGAVSPQSVPEHLPGPLIGPVRPRVIPECRPDQLPVHKVCRMQDLQPREGTEGRGCHIIVLPHPADVRIGIVRIDNGVDIVCPPVGVPVSSGILPVTRYIRPCHQEHQGHYCRLQVSASCLHILLQYRLIGKCSRFCR